MTGLHSILLYFATALLCIVSAAAQAGQANSLCPGTLDFGNISDGLGTINANINSDLVQLLEERSGCRIRIVSMPAKRVLSELENGTLHMSGRFFQTEERSRVLWFAHVQRTKVLAWYRADRPAAAAASKLMQSRDLVLGMTAGFSNSSVIDGLVAQRQKDMPERTVIFPDRQALFQGLVAGRVDFILMPASIVEELGPSLNPSGVAIASSDLAPGEPGAPGGIVFSKKLFDAESAAKWQEIVARLCEDGSVLRVFRKYFRATEGDLACTLKTP